jgi:transforming growth factor-beta-induced protein
MLGHQNLTIFKKLIEYGGFSNDFDNLENITYFVPNDEAFEKSDQGKFWMQMLDESPQKLKNNEKLKRFLEYHVSSPLIKTRDFKEKMLTTIGDDQNQLRINLFSTMPSFANIMNRATINCARVIHFDQETCGSVVHQIDNVLTLPEMNLLEMLRTNSKYSQFYKLVMKANLSSLLEEASEDGYTVLVPRDDIFSELADWISEKKEAGEIDDLIRNHIVSGVKCCASIIRSQWPFVNSFKTLANNHLSTNRDRRPRIQNAAVTKCDIIAQNGVIHEINDVINIETRRREPAANNNNNFGFQNIFNRPFFFKK